MNTDFFEFWLISAKVTTTRYFMLAGGIYFVFYFLLRNVLVKRKIQRAFPKRERLVYELLHSLQTILIFATISSLVLVEWRPYTRLYDNINEYSRWYYWATFPVMFLVHDTYFYWMHRAIHSPWLFRHVHLVHHRSTNPTPLSSYSFHFLESILEGGIIPLIAFTIPVHQSALFLFLLMQFVYNIYGHLGYEIMPRGFNKTWIGRWMNTSVAHNQHHKYFKGNYGLYFLFWDRLMGTIHPKYDAEFDAATRGKTSAG